MWWHDLLWGFWNGLTPWVVLIVHVLGGWDDFPFYNVAKTGKWYDFGFLLGAGSAVLGALRGQVEALRVRGVQSRLHIGEGLMKASVTHMRGF